MLTKNERKTLALFAIILGTFASMVETQEGKAEFVRQIEVIKRKISNDMSKKAYVA